MLVIAQVLGHLLVQRGLEHRPGQLLEQTVRARQRQALILRPADQLDSGQRLRRGPLRLLIATSFSVAVISRHLPRQPTGRRVRPETPFAGQSLTTDDANTNDHELRLWY